MSGCFGGGGHFDGAIKNGFDCLSLQICYLLSPAIEHIQWALNSHGCDLYSLNPNVWSKIHKHKIMIMLIDWTLTRKFNEREMIHETSINKSKSSTRQPIQDRNRTTAMENNKLTWLNVEQSTAAAATTTTKTANWYTTPKIIEKPCFWSKWSAKQIRQCGNQILRCSIRKLIPIRWTWQPDRAWAWARRARR